MASIIRAIRNVAKGHGPMRLAKLAVHGLSEFYYERRLGIRTLGYVDRKQLGYRSREYHFYAPTAYRDLNKALRLVAIRPGEDVFLDYGSGMGRVIIAAAGYPCRRVIGVELSEELNRIALGNVERARRKLVCKDIEIVQADAAAYTVPHDVTVVYLYNPFEGQLLAGVMELLRKSLEECPRPLRLIFKNPVSRADISALCPWLTARQEFECVTGHRCVIYENSIPAGTLVGRLAVRAPLRLDRCGRGV